MPRGQFRFSADPGQSANPTIQPTRGLISSIHTSCKSAVMKFDCAGCSPTLRYLPLSTAWMARRHPSIDAQLLRDRDLSTAACDGGPSRRRLDHVRRTLFSAVAPLCQAFGEHYPAHHALNGSRIRRIGLGSEGSSSDLPFQGQFLHP